MRTQIEQRLQELKAEFEAGQKMLAQVEERRATLQNTLLRLSGAIQVLEEELGRGDSENGQVASEKQEPGRSDTEPRRKARVTG